MDPRPRPSRTRRAVRIALVVVSTAAVALTALVLVEVRRMEGKANRRLSAHAMAARAAVDAFARDREALAADPFFTQVRPAADAGSFLNPRLDWNPVDPPARPPAALVPDPVLRERLASWGKNWLAEGATDELAGVDLGWMATLSKYGHWELLTDSQLGGMEEPVWATAPLPQYVPLLPLAKLRLARAVGTDAMPAASAEIRHLAWLCTTTEIMLGVVVAAGLLKFERAAVLAHRERRPDSDLQPAMSEEQLASFYRVARAAHMLAHLGTPADVRARAFPAEGDDPVTCHAVNSAAAIARPLRPALEARYSERYAAFDRMFGRTGGRCRFAYARKLWRAPAWTADAEVRLLLDEGYEPNAARLRRFTGSLFDETIALELLAAWAPGRRSFEKRWPAGK